MYTPPAFAENDRDTLMALMVEARLCSLVTNGPDGLMATPLPLVLDPTEGPHGTLYGHLAKANPQWQSTSGEALAIFMGPDAYISPSFYPAKAEHGKVVPTWNYASVHAYGPVEFFHDPARLLDTVSALTRLHEEPRQMPWQVADAPEAFITAQLKGIVGLRMPITRIEGKRKMSQNRNAADRNGVADGLEASARSTDNLVSTMIPRG